MSSISSASNINSLEENPYPYPSHVFVPNFVSVKLSGRDKYGVWKTQMLCLLESYGMLPFINDHNLPTVADQKLWRRSDSLVKGWIHGSLSEETAVCLVDNFLSPDDITARHVWDKLAKMYKYAPQQDSCAAADETEIKDEELTNIKKQLYDAVEHQRLKEIHSILKRKQVKVTDSIGINGNTALHVAVACHTVKNRFLERMLNILEPATAGQLDDVRNSDGSTLLHVAASLGNTNAARLLVTRNRELLFAKDNEGCTPLDILRRGSDLNYMCLLDHMSDPDFEQAGNVHIITEESHLIDVIACKNFELACRLMEERYKVPLNRSGDRVLMAIAHHFPCDFALIEFIIYELWQTPLLTFVTRAAFNLDVKSIWDLNFIMLPIVLLGAGLLWPLKMLIGICMKLKVFNYFKKRAESREDARKLLKMVCRLIKDSSTSGNRYNHSNVIFEAVKRDACDFVQHIVCCFPNAIRSVDEDGHNIAQAALKHRSIKVMALITHGECAKHTNLSQAAYDPFGNNLLHFVARLAHANELTHISGAALQMIFEFQWFQLAKSLLPLCINEEQNVVGETAEMVFIREHMELASKGEKWLKETANSGLVTSTLLTTITFAAAITVPGGNDDKDGKPIFAGDVIFSLFAISDAISMLTSATSLLLFTSIFTSPFEANDFSSHYLKMLGAFTTLFLSALFMIAAFGSTLVLVFAKTNPEMIFIIPLTWLPISCFLLYLNSILQLSPSNTISLHQRLRLVDRIYI